MRSYFWSNAQWFRAKDSARAVTWGWTQQPLHLLVQALNHFTAHFGGNVFPPALLDQKSPLKQCAVFPAHLPSLLQFPHSGHSWMARHKKEEQTKSSTYKSRFTTVMIWSFLYKKSPKDWIAHEHLPQTALLESSCSAQRECCISSPKIFSSDTHLRSESSIY